MSCSTQAESVAFSKRAADKGTVEGIHASPFDRIPDEVLSLILNETYLSALDPDKVYPQLDMPLSNLIVNKRILSLARAIWLGDIYYWREEEQQENQLVNRLTRSDARPLVRRVEYTVAPSARYDLAIISQFTNLVSLTIRVPGIEENLLLLATVTSTLHLLHALKSLTFMTDVAPFGLEDPTFKLAQAVPHFYRLSIDSAPCSGARELCAALPPVEVLNIPDDPVLFSCIPWRTVESLQIHTVSAFVEHFGQPSKLFQSLQAAVYPEPNKPAQRLPLHTLSLLNLALFPPDEHAEENPQTVVNLLNLFDRSGLKHLRLNGETLMEQWYDKSVELDGLETLTIDGGSMSEPLDFRSLGAFLRRLPSLTRLELVETDFLGPNTSFTKYPPVRSFKFLLLFPHLNALLAIAQAYTPILHLTWHTPTPGAKYRWSRSTRKEEFEAETWTEAWPAEVVRVDG